MNNIKNNAARRLFIGAKVYTLLKTDVDANHKTKDKENRIEVKATIYGPKSITVNETKGVLGAGGKQIIVVNGGPGEVRIPANYPFVSEVRQFKAEENTESSPSYFDRLKAAVGIANAHNESEAIRLSIILDDVKAQLDCIKDTIKANNDAVDACTEEGEED